jgi:hypothetical protein
MTWLLIYNLQRLMLTRLEQLELDILIKIVINGLPEKDGNLKKKAIICSY